MRRRVLGRRSMPAASCWRHREREASVCLIHDDAAAALQRAEQNGVDQRLLDLLLDQTPHRTWAECAIVSILREPRPPALPQFGRRLFWRERHSHLISEFV